MGEPVARFNLSDQSLDRAKRGARREHKFKIQQSREVYQGGDLYIDGPAFDPRDMGLWDTGLPAESPLGPAFLQARPAQAWGKGFCSVAHDVVHCIIAPK
jgi:hypothetical protein